MSLLMRLMAPPEKRATFRDTEGWFADWARGGGPTSAGETVGVGTAQTVAAYFAAKRNIAEDIGKVPFKLYRRLPNGGKEPATNNSTYTLIHDAPNDEMSSMAWQETSVAHAIDYGNGYSRINRHSATGIVESLSIIAPERVVVKRDQNDVLFYEVRRPDNRTENISKENMFHLHGLGFDGVVGWSIVKLARETLGTILAATKADGAGFGNSSMPGGIIEIPPMSKEAKVNFLKSWEALHRGAANTGKTTLLEDGAKFNATQINNRNAQHIEIQLFLVEVMARWLRIPPHKIQHLKHATFTNITEQAIEYVGDTLLPWFKRMEDEVNRKLLMPSERARGMFAEHVLNGLLKGDPASRASWYNSQWMIGALSQNDIRRLENMNPIGPDGDIYYVPMNMQPSEIAAKGPREPEPAAVPATEDDDGGESEDDGNVRAAVTGFMHAQRPLLASRFRGLLKLEHNKLKNAFTQDDSEAFTDRFFKQHVCHVRGKIIPIVDAFCRGVWITTVGGSLSVELQERIGQHTALIAERWVDASRAALLETGRPETGTERAEATAIDELDGLAALMSRECAKALVSTVK